MEHKAKNISLEEFKTTKSTAEVETALRAIKGGGSFMCCHTAWYATTGMWIPELVPVFKKLDAELAAYNLPAPVAH